jgi:hypothetical protein
VGEDAGNPRHLGGFLGVDIVDAGMGAVTAQDLEVEHPFHLEVGGKERITQHFVMGIYAGYAFAYLAFLHNAVDLNMQVTVSSQLTVTFSIWIYTHRRVTVF